MPMNAGKRRTAVAACLAGLGVAAGTAAYFVSLQMTAPRTVAITLAACRGNGEARVEIPLQALEHGTSAVPISFGPIDLPGAGGSIRLHFHTSLSSGNDESDDAEVMRSGDMVHLPLTFGRDRVLPERIDLKCLEGRLTGIRYRHEGGGRMFRVVDEPREVAE
jgi:hypothetical protein